MLSCSFIEYTLHSCRWPTVHAWVMTSWYDVMIREPVLNQFIQTGYQFCCRSGFNVPSIMVYLLWSWLGNYPVYRCSAEAGSCFYCCTCESTSCNLVRICMLWCSLEVITLVTVDLDRCFWYFYWWHRERHLVKFESRCLKSVLRCLILCCLNWLQNEEVNSNSWFHTGKHRCNFFHYKFVVGKFVVDRCAVFSSFIGVAFFCFHSNF